MAKHDIVVVGTSAGGVYALRELASGLSADFAGSVFAVMHLSPHSPRLLADAVARATTLPTAWAEHGEPIKRGHIYLAPPDCHLLLEPETIRLTRGPKENRFRPAIDPLFRSAAESYGPRVVGVILTGGLNDGTNGLHAIKRLGGLAVVQDPDEAFSRSMPSNALRYVSVDYRLSLKDIPPLLTQLSQTEVEGEGVLAVPEDIQIEVKIAKEQRAIDAGVQRLGEPSSFACPECHGVLLEMKDHHPERFRCHTGHAYTAESLLSELKDTVENSLWMAARSMDEAAMLLKQLAEDENQIPDGENAGKLIAQAVELEQRGDFVREALRRK